MPTKSFEFGLSSDLFATPLEPWHCRLIYENGFRLVEIMGKHPHYNTDNREEPSRWRRIIEEAGLRVRSFHPHYSELYCSDGTMWERNKKWIIRSCKHLTELGGEYLILHAGKLAENGIILEEHVIRAIHNLEEILNFCEDETLELKICIEHEGDNISGIRNIIELVNDERVGFCFDTSHAALYPKSFNFIEDFKGKIYSVHLSDNQGSNDDHLPPFQGVVDWKTVIQMLIRNGYLGPWHFEVSPGSDSQATLMVMKESIGKFVDLLQSAYDKPD